MENNENLNRFFAGGGAAFRLIAYTLQKAKIVRIATAYFEPAGYQCLREILRGKQVRLLIGRPDTGVDKISEIIKEFFEFLMAVPFEERTRAMEELHDSIKRGMFLINVSSDDVDATSFRPKYLYHHAKLYIADEETAVVTSANFTKHGLMISREAGISVKESEDVLYFIERFDYYYNRSVNVADELLKRLEEWLRIYSPYDIYIRSLIELYGLPNDEDPGTLPQLAGYQKPIVSKILRNMEEYGGSMLVASTGLGKTIMAAHALAYMRMKNEIDMAIVLCPAGLKKMWQRTMRAARISSMEYSYYILSNEDWKRYRDIADLEHDMRRANSKTVIVLDESHHLRNSQEKNEIRLCHERITKAVSRSVKTLLMTATPYSREVSDINSQLMLLPRIEKGSDMFNERNFVYWEVETPGNLSQLPSCIVLTSPSVVKHFSFRDKNDDRFVLFSGNEKRYFPRKIHIKNIMYENPSDFMLLELLKSGLIYRKSKEKRSENLFNELISGDRDPLFEARVVHQFCSSIKQTDSLLSKMEQEDGFEKLRFENQIALTARTAEMRRSIAPYIDSENISCRDDKIEKTIDIIRSHNSEKIVIFCYYHDTSRYVADSIKKILPEKKVEHTVERRPDEVELLIRRFAPVANSIDIGDDSQENDNMDSEEVDILVATTSMSEGFNFQDASIVINFDLPWTVLILAQRMGRILRPWQEPREVFVYNMIPSTMTNKNIHHALNWQNRLIARNKELKSFADIPVIVEQHGSEFEMINLAQSIQNFGDTDLDLDQIFQFIENADRLVTSSFIDDLAGLEENEIRYYRKLPGGIKSYKKAQVKELSIYILFSYRKRLYPAICGRKGEVLLNSNRMDDIIQIIRSSKDEDICLYIIDPDQLDRWLEKSRNEWALRNNYNSEELDILCYMVLVP